MDLAQFNEDRTFLDARLADFDEDISRLPGIMEEFIRGFTFLRDRGPIVTVFGSARTREDEPEYQQARELGQKLAKAGYTVVTGGGKGIMEATNRGAMEASGVSLGVNI